MCCINYKYYTVDRIEEGIAVLYGDGGDKSDIVAAGLPKNIKEGDILRYCEGTGLYEIDEEKTRQAKLAIDERFKNLFKK